MGGLGNRRFNMFSYVKDKAFLNQAYGYCADIINQVKNLLIKDKIESKMSIEGSKRRNMVTQNEEGSIDFDFNLFVTKCHDIRDGESIKEIVKAKLDEVLRSKDLVDCDDSTSVLTTKHMYFTKGNRTNFSIDLAITAKMSNGNYCKLIHEKTGYALKDRWYWNEIPDSSKAFEKAKCLKENNLWKEVRETYLRKKDFYLTNNDYNHPSFVCYVEAVNEIFYKYS